MAEDKGAKSVEETLAALREWQERAEPLYGHRKRMLASADKIIAEIERLALFGEKETTRLMACRDWLDRIGLTGAVPATRDEAEEVTSPEELAEAEAIAERIRAKK